jgi:hypothetical protein
MLAYLHECRDSSRSLAADYGAFSEEAVRIVQEDEKAIKQREKDVEQRKVTEGENYAAPQFAAIGSAGNLFLQDEKYNPAQQSVLLGTLLHRIATKGALKSFSDATDEELEKMVSQFGTRSGADAAAQFYLGTHSVSDVMGPTHASSQCHLEFLYVIQAHDAASFSASAEADAYFAAVCRCRSTPSFAHARPLQGGCTVYFYRVAREPILTNQRG